MTDAPKTIAEMREAAAKVADTLHYPDETKISASIRDAIRALPLPDDAEMEERVARAIHVADCRDEIDADELWPAAEQSLYRALARAAIRAMRGEP